MSDRYRPLGPRGSQRPDQDSLAPLRYYKSSYLSQRDSYTPQRDYSNQPDHRSYHSRDNFRQGGGSSYRSGSYREPYHPRELYESYKRHHRSVTDSEEAPPAKRPPPQGPAAQKQMQPPLRPRVNSYRNTQKPSGPRGNVQGSSKPSGLPLHRRRPPRKLMPHQLYLVRYRATDAYKRIKLVGEGTYGKVYKAVNEITQEPVALKRLRLESEREGFPITAIREIKLLQLFDHENIVSLYEIMVEHHQVYMIFDYTEHDLLGLLRIPNVELSEGHRKFLFHQLMLGLLYLHLKQVIHRDIKGLNILVDSKGKLKIADFGLARTMKVVQDGESPDYTNRVITIWYRPPELLLGATNYGREVDVWGVGCLLLELYVKLAAFQGIDEVQQLCKIYNIMGTPNPEDWPEITQLPWFDMLTPRVVKPSRFSELYAPKMSELGFDLASQLLQMNPRKRVTADEALTHPWFTLEPLPEPLDFLQGIDGEWHEYELKKFRRREKKRAEEEARQKSVNADLAPLTEKLEPPLVSSIAPKLGDAHMDLESDTITKLSAAP